MRPMTTIPTDAESDADIPRGVSTVDAARFAEQRLAAASWWWGAAADLVPASDRGLIVPVLALLEFSFALAGDTRDAARVEERWTWWREEVENASTGESTQPLLVALQPAAEAERFDWDEAGRLMKAIADDAGPRRYESWQDLERSVMATASMIRAVLLRAAAASTSDEMTLDRVIAAVLITGRVRSLRDGFLDQDRLVTPLADWPKPEFEARLRDSALQGWGVDRSLLEESRTAVRATIERIWPWYESAERLHLGFEGVARAWCWLAVHGGARLLQKVDLWNAETALHRPEIAPMWRMILRWRARRAGAS